MVESERAKSVVLKIEFYGKISCQKVGRRVKLWTYFTWKNSMVPIIWTISIHAHCKIFSEKCGAATTLSDLKYLLKLGQNSS